MSVKPNTGRKVMADGNPQGFRLQNTSIKPPQRGAYDKNLFVEEPDEEKRSRPVLKTSGDSDVFAEFNF